MSIYIVNHILDFDFALRLRADLEFQGLKTNLLHLPQFNLDTVNFADDLHILVALMRPQLMKSNDFVELLRSFDKLHCVIVPIIRSAVTIADWPAQIAFEPAIDFTDHSNQSYAINIDLLINNLLETTLPIPAQQSTLKDRYVKALLIKTTSDEILEKIQFDTANSVTPIDHLFKNMGFKIIHNKERRSTRPSKRQETLDVITKRYPHITIHSSTLDMRLLLKYLVKLCLHRYIDSNTQTPIPVPVNIEDWDSKNTWQQWLAELIYFSKDPSSDIRQGNITLCIHIVDVTSRKSRQFIKHFEKWVSETAGSAHYIICSPSPVTFQLSANSVTIMPNEPNKSTMVQLCTPYLERPFAQFLVKNEVLQSVGYSNYLLEYPTFTASMLSVKFEDETDFEGLRLHDYYKRLVGTAWAIGCLRNNDSHERLDNIAPALSKLAALITEQAYQGVATETAIKFIPDQFHIQTCLDAGILTQDGNYFSFTSDFLQNYFAATALLYFGLPPRLARITLDSSNRRIAQRWDQAIIILSHLMPNTNDLLIHLSEIDPLLALDCIISGVSVPSDTYSYILEKTLRSLQGIGDFRVDFAERLFKIDVQSAKAVLVEVMRDSTWEMRMCALDLLFRADLPHLSGVSAALLDSTREDRNNIAIGLRRIGSDSLLTLVQLLRSNDTQIRRKAAWALGALGDKAAAPSLVEKLQDTSQSVAIAATIALGNLNDPQTILHLVNGSMYHNLAVQKYIRMSLVQIFTQNNKQFTNAVCAMDTVSRYAIVKYLCEPADEIFVDFAIQFSYDEDIDVRLAALHGLRNSIEPSVIQRVIDCLSDTERSKLRKHTVSEMASRILSASHLVDRKKSVTEDIQATASSSELVKSRLLKVKTNETKKVIIAGDENSDLKLSITPHPTPKGDLRIAELLNQLKDSGWSTSNNAARELREYTKNLKGTVSLQVMNQIIEVLNDDDWVIRWSGVETLGWIGNVNVIPHLIQRLSDSNWKIKVAAIRALAEIGEATASTALSDMIIEPHAVVREAAAEALGSLGGEKSLAALEKASQDAEEFVRLAAVESLGKIKHKSTIQSLISSLKDKSEHVRWAAANALVGMVDAKLVYALVPSLSDNGGPYWEQKRICDVIAGILDEIKTDEANNALSLWRTNQQQSS